MSDENKKKLHVRIPTYIVRNEEIFLSNNEFLLYARLCFLYFRNYKEEEIVIDHKKLMNFINVSDTRTFKSRLNKLHKINLIKNKVDKLPTKGSLTIEFNSDAYDKGHFTMLDSDVFNYYKNEKIDTYAFRQLFLFKSYINMSDKERDRSFCFVGVNTISSKFKISKTSVTDANEQLRKAKLIKIVKHKLNTEYEYDENSEIVFDRWNNHYYVHRSLH
ncbi:hypothetical protein [Salipaludibacillus sp. CF4.18]|uniref:hypothetical protein n=1 Tax=Salipaludibacillus sp. CF4.18 TaxID=3373081 RepID=UPI003EE5FD13